MSTRPAPADTAGSPDAEQTQVDSSATRTETYESADALIDAETKAKPKRLRVYAAVRIVDYALMALAPVDYDNPQGDQDWAPIGAGTTLSTDREAMFQLAKANSGLLMATTGLPGGKAMVGLQNRAERLATGGNGPY